LFRKPKQFSPLHLISEGKQLTANSHAFLPNLKILKSELFFHKH